MSNTIKGERQFEVDGQQYKIVMSINAYCELEADENLDTQALLMALSDPDKMSFTLLRKLFRYALVEYQPQISVMEAGRLMSQLGTTEALAMLMEAIRVSMPAVTKREGAVGPLALKTEPAPEIANAA